MIYPQVNPQSQISSGWSLFEVWSFSCEAKFICVWMCFSRMYQVAPLYFQAIDKRLDSIDKAPDKDRRRRSEFLPVWERFKTLPDNKDDDPDYQAAYRDLRWAFEELRISLFAQDLGTAEKVSISRLENRVQDLSKWMPKLWHTSARFSCQCPNHV